MVKLTRGERFKDARVTHNVHGNQTTREVAQATGITASLVNDLENDNSNRSVGYDKIVKLAMHYGVSTDWLLGLTDAPTMKPSAVDDLGLPPQVVDRIKEMNNEETDDFYSHEGLCRFLAHTINSPLFEMIDAFRDLVSTEIDAPDIDSLVDELDPPINDLPFGPCETAQRSFYFKLRRTAERDRFASMLLKKELRDRHPEIAGRISVAFGCENIDLEFTRICAYFQRYLEDLTGYREYLDNRA